MKKTEYNRRIEQIQAFLTSLNRKMCDDIESPKRGSSEKFIISKAQERANNAFGEVCKAKEILEELET